MASNSRNYSIDVEVSQQRMIFFELGGVFAMRRNWFDREKIGQNYWKFFFLALLSPVRRGFAMDRSQFLNGLVTFGVYAVLTGLNTYMQTKPYEVEGASIFSTMLLPIIFTALSLFIIAGIIMIIALLMRSGAHYPDVVARFGALLVIPTLIGAIIFIFTLFDARATMFFFFISLLSMIGLFAAISFTVYSYYEEGKSGLDPFYAVLLTFIGIGFLAFIFGNSVFSGFFSLVI